MEEKKSDPEIDIICPRCGAIVYYELIVCPNCGLNFYPEVDEDATLRKKEWPTWIRFSGAVLIGWVLSFFLSITILYLLRGLFQPKPVNYFAQFMLFAPWLVGAWAGGLVAGAVGHQKEILAGVIVGVMSAIGMFVVTVVGQSSPSANLLSAASFISWVLVVAAAVLGAYFNLQIQKGIHWPNWSLGTENRLYQDLLRKARFDRERAERLIDYERRRTPSANRSALIRSAIERWERDNK